MRTFQALALVGGLAAGALATGQAQAASCQTAAFDTIGELSGTPCDVQIQGTTLQISLISTSLPAGTSIAIVASPAGLSVSVIPVIVNTTNLAILGTFNYSIAVLSGTQVLDNVSLSSAVGLQQQVSVSKAFSDEGGAFGPILVNNNGIESQANVSFPDVFDVHDAFTVQPGSMLVVFTNNFGVVPEPATMALLGTGLLGLGLARRRRAAT